MPPDVGPPAYMAIKFLSESLGWAATGANLQDSGLPNALDGQPPDRTSWSTTRAVKFNLKREYEAATSSGGPSLASRTEFSDVEVERNRDALSPILFEYAISGGALEEVHFVYLASPTESPILHIRLTGVNVSSYEQVGSRFTGQQVNFNSNRTAMETRHAYVAGASNIDRITLYYTDIAMGFEGVDRGWSFGSETEWQGASWSSDPNASP